MIVLDVETSGLSPENNSIMSVGAVDFSNPTRQFYEECRVWDNAQVSLGALHVNGFKMEDAYDPNKKTLNKVMNLFQEWTRNIEDITIAGENPDFDRNFLSSSFVKAGLEWCFGHRVIDLHSLSYAHMCKKGANLPLNKNRIGISLDVTLNYVGLPSEPKPHNALTGAKMEAEAFSRIIYGKLLLDEFKKYGVPEYLIQ